MREDDRSPPVDERRPRSYKAGVTLKFGRVIECGDPDALTAEKPPAGPGLGVLGPWPLSRAV
jgi:hypothetical protein